MKDCCSGKEEALVALKQSHGRVLKVVLAINLLMFFVEITAGWMSHSTALLADSLDMLGDTLVYGFSLFVLGRGVRWESRAAMAKGAIMLAFGIGVLVEAVAKFSTAIVPEAPVMTAIGTLALVMNIICFVLLWRHRADNVNMSSTWICSRNDLIANTAVILAALLTFGTVSKWPDLVVGVFIAGIFLRSAWSVLREARSTYLTAHDSNASTCCSSEQNDSKTAAISSCCSDSTSVSVTK